MIDYVVFAIIIGCMILLGRLDYVNCLREYQSRGDTTTPTGPRNYFVANVGAAAFVFCCSQTSSVGKTTAFLIVLFFLAAYLIEVHLKRTKVLDSWIRGEFEDARRLLTPMIGTFLNQFVILTTVLSAIFCIAAALFASGAFDTVTSRLYSSDQFTECLIRTLGAARIIPGVDMLKEADANSLGSLLMFAASAFGLVFDAALVIALFSVYERFFERDETRWNRDDWID